VAHMHYKGTGRVHSFKGLLVDGGQDELSIEGSVGAIAWRITKLQLFPARFGIEDQKSTVSVWREEQASVSNTLNFTNNKLLGAACMSTDNSENNPLNTNVVFDNAIFVRNIWVTHLDAHADNTDCNYYIELEEVTVSATGKAQLALAAARRTGDR